MEIHARTNPEDAQEVQLEKIRKARAYMDSVGLITTLYSETEKPKIYNDSQITINYQMHGVRVRGKSVQLSPLEFKLLATLVNRAGSVVTREEILEQCWETNEKSRRSLHALYSGMNRLKEKIEGNSRNPHLVLSVPRVGYIYQRPFR